MPQEMYDVIAAQSEKGLDDDKNTSIIVAPNFTRQEVKTLLVSGSFQNTGVVAGSSASQPLPLASETPVLSSKIQVLVDSMSEEDGQKFKESCSQNDLVAFEHMTSPVLYRDDAHSDKFTVVDTGGTVRGLDYPATVADLKGKGLELMSDRLLESKQHDVVWTWLEPETRGVPASGRALRGFCGGGRSCVYDRGALYSNPFLAGCGLRRVQKKS